jgi:hypothetical protein
MVIKDQAKKFNEELKKNLHTAIIAAFSFIMALAWRDAISEYITEITSVSPFQGKLISAAIVTILAVVGILIVTSFLTKKE